MTPATIKRLCKLIEATERADRVGLDLGGLMLTLYDDDEWRKQTDELGLNKDELRALSDQFDKAQDIVVEINERLKALLQAPLSRLAAIQLN